MADNEFNLIKFDGLGKFGKTLLEKLSNAIGWIATPDKVAQETYIEWVNQSDFDPLTKAVMISNARKIIAEYSNQREIVQYAVYCIKDNAQLDKVDNDWLSQFMDKARLVSDSDFQKIWGHILAEECNDPGSLPRSLLHTLDKMDRKDAERFTLLGTFSVLTKDNDKYSYVPIILDSHLKDYYSPKGLDFDALIDLKSLGLIEVDVGPFSHGYCTTLLSKPNVVFYFDKQYKVPDIMDELPVGNVLYTKTGQALRRAIKPEQQEDFFNQYCIPFWEKRVADIAEIEKRHQGK